MKKVSCIYEILNKVNGHRYIGSTVSFTTRKRSHRSNLRLNKHHSQYLQNAWRKYGNKNFVFKIIEECAVEDLIKREQFFMDTLHPEYNIAPTAGNPMLGRHHSEEALERMSKSQKGHKGCWKGKEFSEEHKLKLSKAHKGRVFSEEHRLNLSKAHKGKVTWNKGKKCKPHTEKARKKISEANRGTNNTNSILTDDIVKDLRVKFKQRDSTVAIFLNEKAAKYKVTTGTIKKVVYGYTWKHLLKE